MLPGPVFQVELLTSARRRRYYVFRVLYLLTILLVVWQSYSSTFGYSARAGVITSTDAMSRFAQRCFEGFSWIQGVTVLFLTPALVSGAIADERQRKTLHYLLASQLTGSEIVLGKLMARFLHLGVIVALGLPVMSLLSLFGGIVPAEVAMRCLGTLTTALMIAAISVAVSAVSRRARDAILTSYVLSGLWLFGPFLFQIMTRNTWPTLAILTDPLTRLAVASSPMGLIAGPPGMAGLGTTFGARFAWMVGLQLTCTALIVGLATARLRPSFRNEGGVFRRFGRPKRASRPILRRIGRPPCGDDPMVWKERYASRMGSLALASSAILALSILAGLGWAVYETAGDAIHELRAYGYGYSGDNDGVNAFNAVVRGFSVVFYVLIALGIASAAAAGVAGEKEQDTWTSLVASDLTGEEILRAKMFGAVWSLRWFLGLMLALLLSGLVIGSLHPFGFLLLVVEVGVFSWFAAALGTFFSLRCRNSTRALVWTIGLMLVVNGGYAFIVALFYNDSPAIMFACTPFIIGISGASYANVWQVVGFTVPFRFGPRGDEQLHIMIACAVGLMCYFIAAVVLTWRTFASFDELIDRPRPKLSIADGPPLKEPKLAAATPPLD